MLQEYRKLKGGPTQLGLKDFQDALRVRGKVFAEALFNKLDARTMHLPERSCSDAAHDVIVDNAEPFFGQYCQHLAACRAAKSCQRRQQMTINVPLWALHGLPSGHECRQHS